MTEDPDDDVYITIIPCDSNSEIKKLKRMASRRVVKSYVKAVEKHIEYSENGGKLTFHPRGGFP